ncbi:MAG: rhamnose utilization protein RhaD (predicted bifunctional aldolase and dehydrogenase) [Reinekea sp.]|jgi:rhamnose utilization protein RhaD (predicted bifunctional aldolase and dehydrogenase)
MTNLVSEMNTSLLAQRVTTSRLLGQDPHLVLYGGGNTSLKATDPATGRQFLWVKGSGYDLADITVEGFTKLPNTELLALLAAADFGDVEMMDRLNALKCDASMPSPSVEALMHAVIPYAFVDHTHASSVVTLTNTEGGLEVLARLFPDFLIVPYQMAGKLLSIQIAELVDQDISRYKGIILQHHGVVTYSDDAEVSCQRMIDCEQKAADYLSEWPINLVQSKPSNGVQNTLELKNTLEQKYQRPVFVQKFISQVSEQFSVNKPWREAASRGTLTPEHVIRLKPFPMVVTTDVSLALDSFQHAYQQYFATHHEPKHIRLSDLPKWCIVENEGVFAISFDEAELEIIEAIANENMQAMAKAETISQWQPLPEAELFAIEYWELEQRKLKK